MMLNNIPQMVNMMEILGDKKYRKGEVTHTVPENDLLSSRNRSLSETKLGVK